MAAGLIPQGEIDGRDIQDIRASELVGYTQWHFFAGVAGWPLALRLAGWPEDRPILTASCPCQPFSNAGQKKGESDERHLWPVVHELIKELKPSVCIGEQVSSKLGREWFSRVRTDLEDVGYAVGASDLCAASIGAPHIRQRLYWVADLCSTGLAQRERDGRVQREALERIQGQATIADSGFSGLADAESRRRGESLHRSEFSLAPDGFGTQLRPEGSSTSSGLGDPLRQSGEFNTGEFPTEEAGVSRADWPEYGNLPERPQYASAGMDFWSDFDLVPCADGKTRRVKRGIQCLAHGIPAGVVPGSDPSLQEVEATTEARVMRLKGYGNAIVPQLAAEFIKAFMQVKEAGY